MHLLTNGVAIQYLHKISTDVIVGWRLKTERHEVHIAHAEIAS